MAQELTIRLNTETETPLYRQIYTFIRDEIRSGSLEADERLPSTRALAAGLHVARSTAELAYSQLLSEGYIRAKRNSGYYVNEIENLSELHFETENSSRTNGPDRFPPADIRDEAGVILAGDTTDMTDTTDSKDLKGMSETSVKKDAQHLSSAAEKSVPALTRLGKYVDPQSSDEMIDFSLRHTEMSVFPYSTWKRIMREVMVDANSEMFSHSEPGGDRSLRTTIAHYLHFSRGVRCLPEQVIVGAGNDYLLMLLRHILGEGRRVAMENPSYLRAAQIFRSFGYRLCPVRMDNDGMLPESVALSGADLVYAMPAHQFPVGSVMPVARRAALLGWATEKKERFIIEDDYDSEFRYRGKPIPALQSLDHAGKVIYIGTFSKVIAPAIRISYMILPPALLERYRECCWFFSSTVSRIDQRILNDFMKNGHFERHLNRMRSLYRARHDELLTRLKPLRDRFRILGAGTGLHLVLEAIPGTDLMQAVSSADGRAVPSETMPDSETNPGTVPANGQQNFMKMTSAQIEKELARQAMLQGVIVYCMSDYALPDCEQNTDPAFFQPRFPSLLLGFGALDEKRITEGISRLQKAWQLQEDRSDQ